MYKWDGKFASITSYNNRSIKHAIPSVCKIIPKPAVMRCSLRNRCCSCSNRLMTVVGSNSCFDFSEWCDDNDDDDLCDGGFRNVRFRTISVGYAGRWDRCFRCCRRRAIGRYCGVPIGTKQQAILLHWTVAGATVSVMLFPRPFPANENRNREKRSRNRIVRWSIILLFVGEYLNDRCSVVQSSTTINICK